jgi:hypothetical protein
MEMMMTKKQIAPILKPINVPIPLNNRPTSRAAQALESLALGQDNLPESPVGAEPAKHIVMNNGTGSGNTPFNALDGLGVTPGEALDAYIANLVKQQQQMDKRIKALEAAIAQLSKPVAVAVPPIPKPGAK